MKEIPLQGYDQVQGAQQAANANANNASAQAQQLTNAQTRLDMMSDLIGSSTDQQSYTANLNKADALGITTPQLRANIGEDYSPEKVAQLHSTISGQKQLAGLQQTQLNNLNTEQSIKQASLKNISDMTNFAYGQAINATPDNYGNVYKTIASTGIPVSFLPTPDEVQSNPQLLTDTQNRIANSPQWQAYRAQTLQAYSAMGLNQAKAQNQQAQANKLNTLYPNDNGQNSAPQAPQAPQTSQAPAQQGFNPNAQAAPNNQYQNIPIGSANNGSALLKAPDNAQRGVANPTGNIAPQPSTLTNPGGNLPAITPSNAMAARDYNNLVKMGKGSDLQEILSYNEPFPTKATIGDADQLPLYRSALAYASNGKYDASQYEVTKNSREKADNALFNKDTAARMARIDSAFQHASQFTNLALQLKNGDYTGANERINDLAQALNAPKGTATTWAGLQSLQPRLDAEANAAYGTSTTGGERSLTTGSINPAMPDNQLKSAIYNGIVHPLISAYKPLDSNRVLASEGLSGLNENLTPDSKQALYKTFGVNMLSAKDKKTSKAIRGIQ